MLRIHEIKLELSEPLEKLPEKILKRTGMAKEQLISWTIYKESIDARNKEEIRFVYSIDIVVQKEKELLRKAAKLKLEKVEKTGYRLPEMGSVGLTTRPVVIGFGPCGMFAALILSEMGYRPIIFERGKEIDERSRDVRDFWQNGRLSPESNVQFGEGGAGAFSDGKLTTQIKDPRVRKVLQEMADAGGPAEILYKQKPHIGTDILRNVVINIRKKIISNGGEIHFSSRLSAVDDQTISILDMESQKTTEIKAEAVVLAIGHSARDTMTMLLEAGLVMEQKAFSIGVRVEHPQRVINRAQYGIHAADPRLGAAEYKLSHHSSGGRGVYTFCMCPGGQVIGAASEEGGVVTNGMSYHNRNAANANSALLVDVRPEDFPSEHPLAGIEFQRIWERKAFQLGGAAYKAPAQKIGAFLNGGDSGGVVQQAETPQREIIPTYQPGIVWADLHDCLPEFASAALQEALPVFGQRLAGFDDPEGILTGVETRSSSPVRIKRDHELRGSIACIYPAGEGAGYAGGIISAAVDGIKAAEAIAGRYAPQV